MAQELRHAAFCLKCILQVEQRPQKPVAEAPTNSAVTVSVSFSVTGKFDPFNFSLPSFCLLKAKGVNN